MGLGHTWTPGICGLCHHSTLTPLINVNCLKETLAHRGTAITWFISDHSVPHTCAFSAEIKLNIRFINPVSQIAAIRTHLVKCSGPELPRNSSEGQTWSLNNTPPPSKVQTPIEAALEMARSAKHPHCNMDLSGVESMRYHPAVRRLFGREKNLRS